MAMMSSLKELVQNQSLLYYCINPDPETLSGLTGYGPDEDNGIYGHDSQSVGYCDSLTVMLSVLPAETALILIIAKATIKNKNLYKKSSKKRFYIFRNLLNI